MFENLVNLFNQQSTFIQVVVVAIVAYVMYLVYLEITKEKFANNTYQCTMAQTNQLIKKNYGLPTPFVCNRPSDEKKCIQNNDGTVTFKPWNGNMENSKYWEKIRVNAGSLNPKRLYYLVNNEVFCKK